MACGGSVFANVTLIFGKSYGVYWWSFGFLKPFLFEHIVRLKVAETLMQAPFNTYDKKGGVIRLLCFVSRSVRLNPARSYADSWGKKLIDCS